MLSDLPLTVLIQILSYVLVWDSPIDPHWADRTEEEFSQLERGRRHGLHLSRVTKEDLSLLAVSREIRHWALYTFWMRNGFRISGGFLGGDGLRTRFLELQRPENLAFIRKLSVEIAFGDIASIPDIPGYWSWQAKRLFELQGLFEIKTVFVDFLVERHPHHSEPLFCHLLWDRRVVAIFQREIRRRHKLVRNADVGVSTTSPKLFCQRHAPADFPLTLAVDCPESVDNLPVWNPAEETDSESDSRTAPR